MTDVRLLRVQDSEGRGPWKPGFSMKWIDKMGPERPPPHYSEFDGIMETVADANKNGKHVGCAALGVDGLDKWFTPKERKRLHKLGYRVVDVSEKHVAAMSENQAVIFSDKPFSVLPTMTFKIARQALNKEDGNG